MFFVFDLRNEDSFEICKLWFQELKGDSKASMSILLGNMKDLKGKRIEAMEIDKFVEREKVIYSETCAENVESVVSIFSVCVLLALELKNNKQNN